MSRGDGVAAGGDSCEHERLRDRGDSRLIGGHIITRHHIDPLSVGGIIAERLHQGREAPRIISPVVISHKDDGGGRVVGVGSNERVDSAAKGGDVRLASGACLDDDIAVFSAPLVELAGDFIPVDMPGSGVGAIAGDGEIVATLHIQV